MRRFGSGRIKIISFAPAHRSKGARTRHDAIITKIDEKRLSSRRSTLTFLAMIERRQDSTRELLDRWRDGDLAARDRLFLLLYPEIEKVAAVLLRSDRGVSLSARDLVHEVMMRLIRLDQIAWHDKSHFLALAARMMRRALIDHARRKRALRRDHVQVELNTRIEGEPAIELDDIDGAITKLATINPIYAEIVEMRYFGGLSLSDIGVVLNCSESTAKRRWRTARAWLLDHLASARAISAKLG